MPSGKSRFDHDDAAARRPRHPDFWTLSEIVIALDALSQRDDADTAVVEHLDIDMDSLMYIAQQRTMLAAQHGLRSVMELGLSVYTDGFAAGQDYARRTRGSDVEFE